MFNKNFIIDCKVNDTVTGTKQISGYFTSYSKETREIENMTMFFSSMSDLTSIIKKWLSTEFEEPTTAYRTFKEDEQKFRDDIIANYPYSIKVGIKEPSDVEISKFIVCAMECMVNNAWVCGISNMMDFSNPIDKESLFSSERFLDDISSFIAGGFNFLYRNYTSNYNPKGGMQVFDYTAAIVNDYDYLEYSNIEIISNCVDRDKAESFATSFLANIK